MLISYVREKKKLRLDSAISVSPHLISLSIFNLHERLAVTFMFQDQ